MVYTSNLTNSNLVYAKAGSYADPGFNTYISGIINDCEGTVNVTARYDLSNAGSLNLIGSAWKTFVSDIVSSLASIHAVNYNLNAYPTRIQAEDIINVQRDNALRGLAILKDINVQETMGLK